ncbi:type 1 glutamine amidotransferase [Pelagibacteraceae bacterium]|nr:type 1 glutamine amidotransferase [Pelagibacteraceae bacterium]
MNILLVDGNEKEASDRYKRLGMETQYEVYEKVLKKNSKSDINITTIHPAIHEEYLPLGINLDDFEAIAWTGSLLNIYDQTKPIIKQIELAKELFKRKNKIFGSCWGLQVLVTAAGGKVRNNPNGLEAIVARNIKLSDDGINHEMYKNKQKSFNAFCWHYDEAETLPKDSLILASNEKSKFQSISFKFNQSTIWAVQYHPEFNPKWMAGLIEQRKEILLENNIYEKLSDLEKEKKIFENQSTSEFINNSLYNDVLNEEIHSLELTNWLNQNN